MFLMFNENEMEFIQRPRHNDRPLLLKTVKTVAGVGGDGRCQASAMQHSRIGKFPGFL